MEIWELLQESRNWCKDSVAETKDGVVVEPHDPSAEKFSIIGALVRCYVPIGAIWSQEFENKRTSIFNAIASNSVLREQMRKAVKTRSMKYVQLGDLNTNVDFDFVRRVLTAMRTDKRGS